MNEVIVKFTDMRRITASSFPRDSGGNPQIFKNFQMFSLSQYGIPARITREGRFTLFNLLHTIALYLKEGNYSAPMARSEIMHIHGQIPSLSRHGYLHKSRRACLPSPACGRMGNSAFGLLQIPIPFLDGNAGQLNLPDKNLSLHRHSRNVFGQESRDYKKWPNIFRKPALDSRQNHAGMTDCAMQLASCNRPRRECTHVACPTFLCQHTLCRRIDAIRNKCICSASERLKDKLRNFGVLGGTDCTPIRPARPTQLSHLFIYDS